MNKFKLGFIVVMCAMNMYWTYYPPSDKYMSHTLSDSKYNQKSLYHSVVMANCSSLVFLIIEFWYLCDHSMRGKEFMIYITLISIVAVNRCLIFALHPINTYYLNRLSIFTSIFFLVPIFIFICLYCSSKSKTNPLFKILSR